MVSTLFLKFERFVGQVVFTTIKSLKVTLSKDQRVYPGSQRRKTEKRTQPPSTYLGVRKKIATPIQNGMKKSYKTQTCTRCHWLPLLRGYFPPLFWNKAFLQNSTAKYTIIICGLFFDEKKQDIIKVTKPYVFNNN